MAATVTTYGNDLKHIGRDAEWFYFDVAGVVTEGTGGVDEEGDLRTLPIGTIMIDATVQCIVAGEGTGTDVCNIEIDDGTTERLVFTGTADNGGQVDVIDRGVVVDGSAFPLSAEQTVRALRQIDDDVTTPAQYRIAMLLCRPEYDR